MNSAAVICIVVRQEGHGMICRMAGGSEYSVG